MNKDFYNDFMSPIPKHLTPEEREEWEKELEWERQERKRREKVQHLKIVHSAVEYVLRCLHQRLKSLIRH